MGSSQSLPEIDNLLVEFQTFLADKNLKTEINHKKIITTRRNNNVRSSSNSVLYVEKLLRMQIEDHRKFAISLILAPYFVNIQNLSDVNSFSKIKQWILRCDGVRKLEPCIGYFDYLINRSIERAKETGIKPLKFEETLQYKNRELYDLLHHHK
jgi:Primase X